MLVRNKFPFIFGFWHFVFSQFFLASFPLVFQLALGEPQRSCSRTVTDTVGTKCQLACQCRPYPPLPPPPPPPPPPRIMFTVPPPVETMRKPWWNEMLLVLWTGSCASVIFLLLTAIVCYKAIKRVHAHARVRAQGAVALHMAERSLMMSDGGEGRWD